MTSVAAQGPLAGLRVLDFTQLAPGPYATMLLGDLGADVITVERPAARREGAIVTEVPLHGGHAARELGINPMHRSRRSIVLDLKDPADLDVALRLADRADVFLEGFRPGVCDRLGIGYEALSARNPGLVYCSITGYGQEGPSADKPGHDINYLAETGLLAITTREGQRPAIPLNLLGDFAGGGMLAAIGILAALHERVGSGRGTHVDVAMVDGILSMLGTAESWRAAGAPDPSWGHGMVSGAAPFYDCYATSDGRWLAVGCVEPKFFAALCAALGQPELAALQSEHARWPELRAALEARFAEATLDDWLERLATVDTAVSPVRSLEDAFARARVDGIADADGAVGPVPRGRGWPRTVGPAARRAGEHRDEILAELEP